MPIAKYRFLPISVGLYSIKKISFIIKLEKKKTSLQGSSVCHCFTADVEIWERSVLPSEDVVIMVIGQP